MLKSLALTIAIGLAVALAQEDPDLIGLPSEYENFLNNPEELDDPVVNQIKDIWNEDETKVIYDGDLLFRVENEHIMMKREAEVEGSGMGEEEGKEVQEEEKNDKLETTIPPMPTVEPEVQNKKGRKLEETVEVNQSSNVLDNNAPNLSKESETHTNLKNEEIKMGESNSEPQKGSKDTTLLIVLFAAVVVIGGAAFGYNHIRKRKLRRENEQNRIEKGKEQEMQPMQKNSPEVKPLLNGQQTNGEVVEYTDEKKGENKEVAVTNGTEK